MGKQPGGSTGSERFEASPYWVVITEMESGDEYASATVDAPTKKDAKASGERTIASQKETPAFDVVRVRGPFPKSPGESAPKVRPDGCHGCGLHCWGGEMPPCPISTWFERDGEDEDAVIWKCIQCSTRTRLPKETMVA